MHDAVPSPVGLMEVAQLKWASFAPNDGSHPRRYLLQFIDHLGGWGSGEGMDQVELPVEGYVAGRVPGSWGPRVCPGDGPRSKGVSSSSWRYPAING